MRIFLLIGLLLLSSAQVFANAAAVVASRDDDETINSVGGIPIYWLHIRRNERTRVLDVVVEDGGFFQDAVLVPLKDYRCKDGLRESVLFRDYSPYLVVCWQDIRKN